MSDTCTWRVSYFCVDGVYGVYGVVCEVQVRTEEAVDCLEISAEALLYE
jgi:hypothetical protein